MGVSTNGILCFGFDLGEEIERPAVFLNNIGTPDEDEKWGDDTKDFPVELITHCSGEYPMYIIALKNTHVWANRGYPQVIEELPIINIGTIVVARRWCEANDIEWQEPKWLLCSYWG